MVDSNILMYAAGARHPHKAPSAGLLEGIAAGRIEAAIDAEVLQEILHRYRALGRWGEGREVYDLARTVFSTVLPVTADILDSARLVLDQYAGLTARDAVHAAVVGAYGLEGIFSYDRDFDEVRGVRRVEPGSTAIPV